MERKEKIFLIDDEPEKVLIFRTKLEHHGYDVLTSDYGNEGLEQVKRFRPELILLDINKPSVTGHDLRASLEEKPATRHLPVVLFSSGGALDNKLRFLHEGAGNYITKNVDHSELAARIEVLKRRYKKGVGVKPLTNLPGNTAIEKDIQAPIAGHQPFSVRYADMDNFKAYVDAYGFKLGHEIIKRMSEIISDSVHHPGTQEDFAGHIGGDDFVFVWKGDDRCVAFCKDLTDKLNCVFPLFCNVGDRTRGYIVTTNRKNVTDRYPLVSVSITVITQERRYLSSIRHISRFAGEIKKTGGPGNRYYTDMRSDHAQA